MIVLEERLAEIFDTLPDIVNADGSFKPAFGYGDDLELSQFLKAKINQAVHPLVWLVYGNEEKHDRNNKFLISQSTTFIIAAKNIIPMLNEQRMKKTYSNILNPMLKNVKTALMSSGITQVMPIGDNVFFSVVKVPNYTKSIHIWDAIKLTCSIKVNACTFTQINY